MSWKSRKWLVPDIRSSFPCTIFHKRTDDRIYVHHPAECDVVFQKLDLSLQYSAANTTTMFTITAMTTTPSPITTILACVVGVHLWWWQRLRLRASSVVVTCSSCIWFPPVVAAAASRPFMNGFPDKRETVVSLSRFSHFACLMLLLGEFRVD